MGKKKKEIKVEIKLVKKNLEILKKAKKECTCQGNSPHYHQLLHYDEENGDIYFEESDEKHQAFIVKLTKELKELQKREK